MGRLLENGWTKAFQSVKTGATQIQKDVVWLLRTARASLS